MQRDIPLSKKCRYAAEAVLAYVLYGLLRLLPVEAASAAGGRVLKIVGPRMGVSRVALKNLDLAFPEKTADEKKKIVTDMWENLGRVLGEYPHLRRMSAHIETIGTEHFDAARTSGKPSIFFGGHLGNWEISGICGQDHGLPLFLVYRKPNNPYVDKLLRRARAMGPNCGYIEKGPAGARAIRNVVKNNGVIAMLMDQKLNEGMAVPFFGHDAMTAPAIAHFAMKFGMPVYPSHVERLSGARFRVTIHPALPLPSTGDREQDTRQFLVAINRYLEDWIRQRPEQWLWIHRRWPESR